MKVFLTLTILFSAFFLISCNKDTSSIEEIETEDSIQFYSDYSNTSESVEMADIMLFPKGVSDKGADEVMSYLVNLSDELSEELKDNNRIAEYLKSIGIYDSVYSKLENGQVFSDIEMDQILTNNQQIDLHNFDLKNASEFRQSWKWRRCFRGPSFFCTNRNWLLQTAYNSTGDSGILCRSKCVGKKKKWKYFWSTSMYNAYCN